MSNIPFHIKIMAKIGIVKVTEKKQYNIDEPFRMGVGNLPRGFDVGDITQTPRTRSRRRFRFPTGIFIPLGILIPVMFGFLPFFDQADTNTKIEDAQTLQEKAMIVAEKEEKNEWEKTQWDNPEAQIRLMEIKREIDVASCPTLAGMFETNERWTLRAYVAHTILEKKC